jgi:sulfide:quinone oxidoreductase
MTTPPRVPKLVDMTTETHQLTRNVLIAGGGVAALEAMMALRALAGDRVDITVLTPGQSFHYRPMAVAEPFSIAHARRVELATIAADFEARLVAGELVAVEPEEHAAVTRSGDRIEYDALVIACGTQVRPAMPGAVTIDDRNLGATLHGLVQDVEEGYVKEIAFVANANAFWPLPLFELALMTAQRADGMCVDVDISIISPEHAPLALLGDGIATELGRVLDEAGITFHGASYAEYERGELTLRPSGARTRPGRVVALPQLQGPGLPGIESDPHGFIPVDEIGAVHGAVDVYAAGDATWFPIKHGGIAAQQADVVATAIAAAAGVDVQPEALRPVLRGMLLTGREPYFLEARSAGEAGFASTMSTVCPWEQPGKIVARYLGPYLAKTDHGSVRA